MVAANSSYLTPSDVVRIVFRHRRKMTVFFCTVIALTLLVIALYPRSYSSEAKLLLRIGRESVALDPTATTGETIMLQKTQNDEINSALSILTSRTILEQAVEKVGATRILDDQPQRSLVDGKEPEPGTIRRALDSGSDMLASLLQTLRLSDPGTDEELAVRRLQRDVSVFAPKGAMVISVTYSAASPQLAHDVVEAITNAFLNEHVRLSQSEGSLNFFAKQVESLHEELAAAQAALRDKKNSFRLTSSVDRVSIRERQSQALRQKLYDLEMEESELKSRYTDAYPPLKEVRRQRDEAARQLTELTKSDAAAIASVGNAADADVTSLNEQEFQLAQLERKVQLLEGKYRMHVEKLEQARVNDALTQEQISNVKIAQAATLVGKPDSPKKQILAGLGLIVAFFGSISLAFLAESMDPTLRTTEQVESQLGLPVLVSFPERKRRRRSAMKQPNGTEESSKTPGTLDCQARYGTLLRELMSNSNGDHPHARTVGVVGCESSKSRSQVAADLALQAARSCGDQVLLIDADARRRRVTKRFQLNGSPGWREVAAGEVDVESCVHRPKSSNLRVMSPGAPDDHAVEAAAPTDAAVSVLSPLDEIKHDYRLVVVDMPPACDMDSNTPSTDWLDETVLVVEAERTRIQAAKRAKESLQRAGVHVTGVVLANRREHIPRWLHQRLS